MNINFYTDLAYLNKVDKAQMMPIEKEDAVRLFNTSYLMNRVIFLAHWSRYERRETSEIKNFDFIFDFDLVDLHTKINKFIRTPWPEEDNFYLVIDFWGKHLIFPIVTNGPAASVGATIGDLTS